MNYLSDFDLISFDINEDKKRVKSLHETKLLDTQPEYKFDKITKLTKSIFKVPIVLISLVDEKRQWFKSCIGLDLVETNRKDSICSLTIKNDEILLIKNTHEDTRVNKNSFVVGHPFIKFYAGYPIHNVDNYKIGALCIIDTKERNFTNEESEQLKTLAEFIDNEIKMADYIKSLNEKNDLIDKEVSLKTTIMAAIHHDIINEISPGLTYGNLLVSKYSSDNLVKKINISLKNTKLYADNILDICKKDLNVLRVKMEILMIRQLIFQINDVYNNINYNIEYSGIIYCDKIKIIRVLNNLIHNSNKFIPLINGKITVSISLQNQYVQFSVEDNGKGVPDNEINNLFKLCSNESSSNGIGLYSCKLMIELHNGKIWYERKNNKTYFIFIIPFLCIDKYNKTL
jgi:K+-sensing histidine kinase KdpD